MVEMELLKNPTRRQTQPISVPFLWEAKPGTPKNDWKLIRPSRPPPPHHPIKFVVSVPFEWEEEPGKPLPYFNQPMTELGNKDGNHHRNKNENKDERKIVYELFNYQNDETFNSASSESIPFKWEEKPDKPLHSLPQPTTESGNIDKTNRINKNESKDEKETINKSLKLVPSQLDYNLMPPPPHPPINFSASIPFEWEEKPGKPFPSYHMPTKEFENRTQDEREMNFESDFDQFSFKTNKSFTSIPPHHYNQLDPPLPNPPIRLSAWIPFELETETEKQIPSFPFSSAPVNSKYVDGDENDSSNENESKDESEIVSKTDSETLSFHTDESSSSVPSLPANRLVPAVNIAHAVPVIGAMDSPTGYESDSSTSSYSTGTTSLVGAPFLERLFPLLSPKLSFLEKVGCPEEKENSFEDHKMKLQRKDSVCGSSFNAAVRRPTTLGELIMMSQRRSYIKKAVQIRRHNSMGSTKKGAMGCFMFGINNRIEGLQRKMKNQLQLKLI